MARDTDPSDPLAWAVPGATAAYVDDARPDVVEERTVARATRSQIVTSDGARWRRSALQRTGPWAGALRVLSGIRGKTLAPLDHPEVARRRPPPPAATGGGVRQAVWTAGDGTARHDAATFRLGGDRPTATGTSCTDTYALAWTLVADTGWGARRLEVAVRGTDRTDDAGASVSSWSRDLVLERGPDGRWRCDARSAGTLDAPPPGLAADAPADLVGALDCDLQGLPATSTPTVLRLGLLDAAAGPGPTELVVARVEVPSLRVAAERRTYAGATRDGRWVVRRTSGGVTIELEVDPDGVVVGYPGLARAVALPGAPGPPDVES